MGEVFFLIHMTSRGRQRLAAATEPCWFYSCFPLWKAALLMTSELWLFPVYCIIKSKFSASGSTSVLRICCPLQLHQRRSPTATLWAACPCSSCAETQSCPTCGGASATRRSRRASATAASPSCPPPLLTPPPSCCQPGPWPTSYPSLAPSRPWFYFPTSSLSPSPCPTRGPTPDSSHLPEAWRSGACQAGRAPARPTRGGSPGTWCCRRGSAPCRPGSGSWERPSTRCASSPFPPRRSASRSGCSAAAGRGGAGRGAGPPLRWTSSPGCRCC